MNYLLLAIATLSFALVGCSNPPPECAPKTEPWVFCSDEDNGLFRCPAGTTEQIAANEAINTACEEEADGDMDAFVECTFNAEYEMVEAVLVEDCALADLECYSDPFVENSGDCVTPGTTG